MAHFSKEKNAHHFLTEYCRPEVSHKIPIFRLFSVAYSLLSIFEIQWKHVIHNKGLGATISLI